MHPARFYEPLPKLFDKTVSCNTEDRGGGVMHRRRCQFLRNKTVQFFNDYQARGTTDLPRVSKLPRTISREGGGRDDLIFAYIRGETRMLRRVPGGLWVGPPTLRAADLASLIAAMMTSLGVSAALVDTMVMAAEMRFSSTVELPSLSQARSTECATSISLRCCERAVCANTAKQRDGSMRLCKRTTRCKGQG